VEKLQPRMKPNALALEYQRDYGTAHGNIDITNVLDQPFLKGECRVFGPGFAEKLDSLPGVQVGTFLQNSANPFLVVK